ncbi:MAG: SusD/RagB family nutrient-binding outer membrane lipoprotein [Tissierellia bacterium]|jgi:hypothetical protein|nr:SusD/RagB family nutrient-binding outer membrane lipoprotein [Tissierellia bacterium]
MKKYIINKLNVSSICVLLISTLLVFNVSCSDFESFQKDPNRATEASPALLLTGISVNAFSVITTEVLAPCRMMVNTEGVWNAQYFYWQRAGFGGYDQLRQVKKLQEEAERTGEENYIALAYFFKSWYTYNLTLTFGDIPYSDAMKGDESNFNPKYDRQKDVFIGILNDLRTAQELLSEEKGNINGDVIFDGNLQKWRKAINSFRLRVLMTLSKKENDQNLKIVQEFNEIFSNPTKYPIFTSNDDNVELEFIDKEGNRYPYFETKSFHTAYYLEESFIENLKERKDPRLFIYARPDENAVKSGLSRDDFNAYSGLKGSDAISTNVERVANGEGSRINERYFQDPINEPSVALSYDEIEFTLAEAASRGWIQSDAETHYKNGIKASMKFYSIDDQRIVNYLAEPNVIFRKSNAIEMIVTQKYFSCYMRLGWLPFYTHLRTGFPYFNNDGAGILNNGKLPKRWMYPESEYLYNKENVEQAVKDQGFTKDNINETPWIFQD